MDPAEMLRRGYTRETSIRRDALGHWFDGPTPIEHGNLSQSFAGWVDRAEDGRYCLRNDINWAYVEIDGPAYFVEGLHFDDGVRLQLSGGRQESLDPETLMVDAEGILWCRVRGGRLSARFGNHAANQLASHLEEDAEGIYLLIAGEIFRPEDVADPIAATATIP